LPLAFLVLSACSVSSSVAYQGASVQVIESRPPSYRIQSGTSVVLERCFQRSFPVPDAASGYCLMIPLQPSQVVPGGIVRLGSSSTPAYLWQFNGPSRHLTQAVDGELRIVATGHNFVRATVTVRTSHDVPDRWRWSLQEKARYVMKAVP
jgi:hypothetical protein